MKTSKPVSTVSYNSPAYLKSKLVELVSSGVLTSWAYIYHEPEEGELKCHAHVYLEPSQMVQTDALRREFEEPDPSGNPKPLGCMPMRKSDVTNWWLYGLHDPQYLARKGEHREHVYARADMVTSDDDYFDRQVKGETGEDALYDVLRMCADSAMTLEQVYASGYISPNMVTAVSKLYPAICNVRGVTCGYVDTETQRQLEDSRRKQDALREEIEVLRERLRDAQCQCQAYREEISRITGYSCPF